MGKKQNKCLTNNVAYHLAKSVIEHYYRKTESNELRQIMNDIMFALDDVFPDEENGDHKNFERNMLKYGFVEADRYEELKKKYEKIKLPG